LIRIITNALEKVCWIPEQSLLFQKRDYSKLYQLFTSRWTTWK